MKRWFILLVICSFVGIALAEWRPATMKTATYSNTYGITNLNTAALLRLVGLECNFATSSSGTFYIDLIRGSSVSTIITYDFTSATNLVFSQEEFDGLYLRPNDHFLLRSSLGTALTNTIFAALEAW